MKRGIGTAAVLLVGLLAGLLAGLALAAIVSRDAVAETAGKQVGKRSEASMAVHPSAQRHRRHVRVEYGPSCPEYLDRPCYYAPAPFFPLPPIFGYGWEPW